MLSKTLCFCVSIYHFSNASLFNRLPPPFSRKKRLTIYDDNHALNSTAVRANAKIEIAQFFNKVADKPIFDE